MFLRGVDCIVDYKCKGKILKVLSEGMIENGQPGIYYMLNFPFGYPILLMIVGISSSMLNSGGLKKRN